MPTPAFHAIIPALKSSLPCGSSTVQTMNILYFDCYAGISGDMCVASLLDLGVPLEYLNAELLKLTLPADSFELSARREERGGVAGLAFDVAVGHCHSHRAYAEIDALIAASGLAGRVRERARLIFRRLAEAEAEVHGVAPEQVHFHEVGAIDSIVDIVGCAICLEYLDVGELHAAPLPLGSGFVTCAHGCLPVPAPATAKLLQGLAVHGECGPGERVTPTGAAIVAALAATSGPRPAMKLNAVGSGAGSKEFPDCPNILRAFLGQTVADDSSRDRVVVAETNIDDSTPETLGYVMERLLEEGALDVFFSPIQMKKNRPATLLSFICQPSRLESLAGLVLRETSAIGLRHHTVDRIKLERSITEFETVYGPVRFKLVYEEGRLTRRVPEYEDCRRIARERDIPLQDVLRCLMKYDIDCERK